MDLCIFIIGLIIGIFGIIFWILLFKFAIGISTSSRRKVFNRIALKTNGKVEGTFKPKLSFTHKGCKIEVTGNPEHKKHSNRDSYIPPRTEVIVHLRKNVAHKIIIKRKQFRHKIASKLGVNYIKTGHKIFDDECVVKGDKEFALRILDYKVSDTLSTSYSFFIEAFRIELIGERLLIRIREYSENERFFNMQIDKAKAIIDRLVELGYI